VRATMFLAFVLSAVGASTARADLDFSAIDAEITAKAATATGRTRATCLRLERTLAAADRVGLVDDFWKLRAVGLALTGLLSGDATLSDATDAQVVRGLDAAFGESTSLTEAITSLKAAGDKARCQAFKTRGDRWADLAGRARAVGLSARAATYGRRAARQYETGAAVAKVLLARQNRRGQKWSVPLSGRGGALLSVWTSAGADPDVYVVGADDGAGPIFLRMGAEGWVRVPVAASGTLWWASGVGGEVWAAGTGGRVVRYDPVAGSLADVSVGAAVTLYGVWGAATNDVWAVGGNVDGTQPAGAVYHYDGSTWTNVAPQLAAGGPTLFKVWGAAVDDVWACGQSGTVMHFDGQSWTSSTNAPFESLFTVHGNGAAVVAVGGAVTPTILEAGVELGTAHFWPVALPSGTNNLRGVFVPPTGDAWACGLLGTVLRRTSGKWTPVAGLPATTANDFHAVAVDDAGGVYVVGGDLAAMDRGTMLYFGARTLPPANAIYAQAKLSEKIAPLFSADHGVFREWTCAVGGCHVAASPSGDLDLLVDSHTMWTRLVGVKASASPLARVAPGRPSASYLFQKLSGTQAGQGPGNERMPQGGPYLDQADMDAVRAWILEGARDN